MVWLPRLNISQRPQAPRAPLDTRSTCSSARLKMRRHLYDSIALLFNVHCHLIVRSPLLFLTRLVHQVSWSVFQQQQAFSLKSKSPPEPPLSAFSIWSQSIVFRNILSACQRAAIWQPTSRLGARALTESFDGNEVGEIIPDFESYQQIFISSMQVDQT